MSNNLFIKSYDHDSISFQSQKVRQRVPSLASTEGATPRSIISASAASLTFLISRGSSSSVDGADSESYGLRTWQSSSSPSKLTSLS